jgi:F5/8 type C domain
MPNTSAINPISSSSGISGLPALYTLMTGVTFGDTSYLADPLLTYDKAWDGNISTSFLSASPGVATGIDLGVGNAKTLTKISYYPRPGDESRMTAGVFQGSNDNGTWTTLYTIPSTPVPGVYTDVIVTNSVAYRYYRYKSDATQICSVAEIQLYHSQGQIVTVDFGTTEDGLVTTPVPAPWVTATTKIIIQPAGTITSDHDPDDYGLEGVTAYATNIVPGTGFDLIASARDTTWGKYNFNIIYQ